MPLTCSCKNLLFLAWIITLMAVLLAEYMEKIGHIPVCHLCWYQRICLYPLSLILGIGVFREDYKNTAIYTMSLTFLGATLASMQYIEQLFPKLTTFLQCHQGPSCHQIHFQWFGFITLPFLSLTSFIIITVLASIVYFKSKKLLNDKC